MFSVTRRSVKKQRGKTFGFVIFNSLEEREAGKALLETLKCDKKQLVCKDVRTAPANEV